MLQLLIQNKADVDAVDDSGRTLLMHAAHDGEAQMVTALCAVSANVEVS